MIHATSRDYAILRTKTSVDVVGRPLNDHYRPTERWPIVAQFSTVEQARRYLGELYQRQMELANALR